jgi:diguanylate cyclase (GGDEF)-like protein
MPANDYIITGNKEEISKFNQLYDQTLKQLQKVEETTLSPEVIRKIKKNVEEIQQTSKDIFSIQINEKTLKTAADYMYKMDQKGDQTKELIEQHHRFYHEKLSLLEERSQNNIKTMNIMTISIWVVLFFIGTTVLYFFNNDVKIPIEKLSQGFRGVSHGRWSHVSLEKKDELGMLASEFNSMVERLGTTYEDLENEVRARTKELNDLNKKLEEMAVTDGLSGLYNHKYFQEKLKEEYNRAVRYKRKLALFMIDIDHFKEFNDDFGHQAGDYAIKVVSGILKEESRSTDLVARYGGEEFAILSPEMNSLKAIRFAQRLRKKIENIKLTGKGKAVESSITISIGISLYPNIDGTPETLLLFADEALYKAKRNGRNQVILSQAEKLARKKKT